MEIRCLKSMCGVTLMDRVRNEEVQRTGVVRELADRTEHGLLRWRGHMERMNGERLVKKINGSDA